MFNALSQSRQIEIALNALDLSPVNVRKVAPSEIEELAEDIALRGLLQNLIVRPRLDDAGNQTGVYEVVGGGRRLRALRLLAEQNRINPGAMIWCSLRETGAAAEEDSLAENERRETLHPLDQFRAFKALREKGLGAHEIAARFFVSPETVRQRLKLADVSPKVLDLYEHRAITLETVQAFAVTADVARQDQVLETLGPDGLQPWQVRNALTETSDRRATFVGLEAYEAAGGTVDRDLFSNQGGETWLTDAALLNRLVEEKLAAVKAAVLAEGWAWAETAPWFSWAYRANYRRVEPEAMERCEEIDAMIENEDDWEEVYTPEQKASLGVLISIGFGREADVDYGWERVGNAVDEKSAPDPAGEAADAAPVVKPVSERLVAELTGLRTLALQNALAGNPDVALVALLHQIVQQAFRTGVSSRVLDLDLRRVWPGVKAPEFDDCCWIAAIEHRHETWGDRLPGDPDALWDTLMDMSREDRLELLAHCLGLSVDAVTTERDSASRRKQAEADRLAGALGLDMNEGWTLTADNYLGRVPKERILEAVSEAKGETEALKLRHLKKGVMVAEAERMLAGTGWLPECLRTPDLDERAVDSSDPAEEDAVTADESTNAPAVEFEASAHPIRPAAEHLSSANGAPELNEESEAAQRTEAAETTPAARRSSNVRTIIDTPHLT